MDYKQQKTTSLGQKVGKLIVSLLFIAAAAIMILLGNHYIKIENLPVTKGYIQEVVKHKGGGRRHHIYYVADVELEVDEKTYPAHVEISNRRHSQITSFTYDIFHYNKDDLGKQNVRVYLDNGTSGKSGKTLIILGSIFGFFGIAILFGKEGYPSQYQRD